MQRTAPSELRDAIVAANVRFCAAFRARDPAAIARCYAEDAALLLPGSDIQRGRGAIEKFWQGALDMGIDDVLLDTLEVFGDERRAAEVGRYTLIGSDGAPFDDGKYIVLWRRDDNGEWRLDRDIWNTNRPAVP